MLPLKKTFIYILSFLSFLLIPVSSLCVSCGSKDQLHLTDVIVGTWDVDHYELETESGAEVSITEVCFLADGSATVTYFDGSGEQGRYEAGDAYIRIDYDGQGSEQHFLWQVLSFTQTAITLSYEDQEHHIKAKLWLLKHL
jgi:hypothetical protein